MIVFSDAANPVQKNFSVMTSGHDGSPSIKRYSKMELSLIDQIYSTGGKINFFDLLELLGKH